MPLVQPKIARPQLRNTTTPYTPNPTPRCLQRKSVVTPKTVAQPAAIQRKAAGGNIVQPFPIKPAVSTPPPRTIQLMSFARFWKWGFISNWGSYNEAEQDLLQVERQVRDLIASLRPRTKFRPKARGLIQDFRRIASATIAEKHYKSTRRRLLDINNELHEENEAQEHEDALEDKRQVFRERGRPEVPVIPDIYPASINSEMWGELVGEMPKQSKRWREGKSLLQMVDHLFRNFVSQNFNYNIMQSAPRLLIGSAVTPQTAEGNCIAYARAFSDLLFSFGIDAEVQMVRDEGEGRFIVRVPHFMDPKVTGHIYEKDVLKRGYYMFSSHAATWVKDLGKFYDPMARSSYTSLKQFIECEIRSDDDQNFYPRTPPKTLNPGYKWKLVKTEQVVNGRFNRLELVPWESD